MLESAQRLFDSAQQRLPGTLRATAERYWHSLREQLPRFPHADLERWVPALPRVFATSDFVARHCVQTPGLLQELIASCDLFRAYAPGELTRAVGRALAGVPDEHALKARLRALRRREMVRIAFRDLAGWAELPEVLATLSELADACLEHALAPLEAWARARHGTPTDAGGAPLGLVVLALGKLGGRELNFSSDIDLVFAYAADGETRGPEPLSHHEFFVRLGQSLINVLSEPTGDGFVFRVDLRLRPHGASGPLALSFDAMEQYYQVHGREWERYALSKARAAAGDRAAGAELLARLRPFVFRKYLDYGAFEAMRTMKLLIEREVSRKGMQADIKLGPGGIREIEFIVQALQLIRGGREPGLQEPHLLEVLPRLAAGGYLEETDKEALAHAYAFLRRVEHRLQMAADAQTQTLPTDEVERARLAFANGYDDWTGFERELERRRRGVQARFARLFSTGAALAAEGNGPLAAVWLATAENDAMERALRAAGYADPAATLALLRALREGAVVAALSAEGRARLDRLVPWLLAVAGRDADPHTTLTRLIHLVEAVGRRATYLALMIETPAVLEQLVRLAGASPWVASWIAQHPILLDELIDPRSLYALPTSAELAGELHERLAHIPPADLELAMEVLREFRHGHVLRVAASDLGPGLEPERVGARLADIAETVIAEGLALATRDLIARHGRPGGRAPAFAVIGYGKLGGRELGYGSDLDMIFLYEAEAEATTDGPRPLPAEQFYARLGQRLIHVLTTRTHSGQLYEVDMRLRPSGRSGPLVTSVAAFRDYQAKHAWTWEHQALVRARAVAGDAGVGAAFEAARREILCRPRNLKRLRADVREMRAKVAAAHAVKPPGFDLKHGRGGIVDIEFMVQYGVLRWAHAYPALTRRTDNIGILKTLAAEGLLENDKARTLTEAYRRYLSLEHRLKLMERGSTVDPAALDGLPGAVANIWHELIGA